MRQHIHIEENEFGDGTIYPVDTSEEVDAAIAAMRKAGIGHCDIWNGEPPDAYKTGIMLCSDEGA
jgi:hypothetical protein